MFSVDIIAIDIVLTMYIILKLFVLYNNGAGLEHGVDGKRIIGAS